MWLRRAFFGWLIPAAVLLPLWLLAAWFASGAQALALLWVLLLAMPSVFFCQIISTLLVRSRASVRTSRAVSWWDVAGFGSWHLLIISLGWFGSPWWGGTFVVTVLAGLGLFWLLVWQLWQQGRPQIMLRTQTHAAPLGEDSARPSDGEVFIISEVRSGQ